LIVLVGNQSAEFATVHNWIGFIETSGFTGDNVTEAFIEI
jgi:hypothetical protein